MKKELAFVLSGGGSRGALQVGALRALLEAGLLPTLVTGTSIGAANAAYLAVHGGDLQAIRNLEEVWKATKNLDLLPSNLWWQTMRAILRRPGSESQQRIRAFFIQHGITPEMKFKDIRAVRLYIVSSDLNSSSQVIFGEDPEGSVLEAMMASVALPPWMSPLEKDGRYLLDGGAVSNLPIEAALKKGAHEIFALDLLNPLEVTPDEKGLRSFLGKLNQTVGNRQATLEMELARARGIPVHHIPLFMKNPVPIWDFRHSEELIAIGYDITRQALEERLSQEMGSDGWQTSFRNALERIARWAK